MTTFSQAVDVARELQGRIGKIDNLEERISQIVRRVPGRIAFSTSLGMEDQATLHAIASCKADVDVFTLDTGRLFPETLETLAKSESRYGIRIRVVTPNARAMEHAISRDGVLGFRLSVEARKACCDVRKVQPLRRALAGASIWLTGLRRDQSASRADIPFASWDAAFSLIKISPIADWDAERLNAYISRNDIPINALHALGLPSIGCQTCTRAVRPGEDLRAGRWWWENENGKECGLHAHDGAREKVPS